jgi:hypothetical protein
MKGNDLLRTFVFFSGASSLLFVNGFVQHDLRSFSAIPQSTDSPSSTTPRPKNMVLWSDNSNDKNKKKGGLDEAMKNKLVTESIAPWRTLRLFLYGALGSGAFIGGLINISGAVAASNSPDFNLQTEVGPKE